MEPTEKWLIDVNAYPSAEGWRHPRTNELLKCQKIDMSKVNSKTKETIVSEVVNVEPELTPVPKKQLSKKVKQVEKVEMDATVNDITSE